LVAIASLALMTCHQKNSGFTGRQVLWCNKNGED
jgi:hypothetical protein